MAVPVSLSLGARAIVMLGLVTSVMSRVGSVTSTCLRSSAGDMRTRSGPIFSVSFGTLPGHNSTTMGFGISVGATDPGALLSANKDGLCAMHVSNRKLRKEKRTLVDWR